MGQGGRAAAAAAFTVVAKIPKPVVGGGDFGHALGGGPEPALCAGFRVAGENGPGKATFTGR